MPFTFSHPAIILPLTYLPKRWISLTGLVIGSLTPDFEYFIRFKIQSNYSHTVSGLLWFDLPLGILLAFLFHNIIRDQLFINLPASLKSRLISFTNFNWNQYFSRNWVVVIFSILTGAFSHVLWDSFTHNHGYFVESISLLKSSIELFDIQVPILKILQHASTILGGITIAYVLWKLPVENTVSNGKELKFWTIDSFIAIAIIMIRLLTGLSFLQYGNVITSGISAGIISLIITSVISKRYL